MLTQKDTSDDFYENMTIYPIIESKTSAEPANVYQVFVSLIFSVLDEMGNSKKEKFICRRPNI